jgi:hypothetical protein
MSVEAMRQIAEDGGQMRSVYVQDLNNLISLNFNRLEVF